MNLSDNGLVKSFTATGAIGKFRITKLGAAEAEVAAATDGSAPLAGVTGVIGTTAAGQRVDVYLDGVREVEFGGNVAVGDYLTADAQGRAVTASPADGDDAEIVGRSLTTATAGVRGIMQVLPGRLRG